MIEQSLLDRLAVVREQLSLDIGQHSLASDDLL